MAKDLVTAFKAGEPRALDRIRWNHPRFRKLSDTEIQARAFKLSDAQLVVARVHHFESWSKLLQHVQSMESADPLVKRFEDAADAIISGSLERLRTMLHEHPGLIHQRSTRAHHSTLLHYVSANGVEDYRQVTPPNILDITRTLLDAGASVDATSDAYGGGSTTIGLVATSAHPRLAGVQLALIDLLADRGAVIAPITSSDGTVHGCVANGCPEAAVHLVTLGAIPDTLYGAAGLGILDVVRKRFPESSAPEREKAMMLAAQCNHADVVELLLDHGVDIAAYHDGMTALHWACANGNLSLVEQLLHRGAPLGKLNEFGGTILSNTLWYAYHALPADFALRNYPAVIDRLIAAGVPTDSYPDMQCDIDGVHQRAHRVRRLE
jgi:ankyrin repeat protein